MSTSALGGISVLDLSSTLIGAHVTQLLADFGADVTMVEPPAGHTLRSEPAWPFWSRGKRSVVADLTDAPDRALVRDMASRCDVVLQTWRPGVAERFGLADADLRPSNPRLVSASVTAFGRTGPLRHLKGYEQVVMAKIGALDAFGGITPRPGPAYTSAPYCSFSSAQLCLQGILAALVERERTGLGQAVETTMLQGMAAHDTWNWLIAMLAERYPDAFKASAQFSDGVPNNPLFFRLMVGLSADGRWMQLSQSTDKLWHAFLRLAGLGDLVDAGIDPPLDPDPAIRLAFWERLLTICRSRTYAEWLAGFDADTDVWAETFRGGLEPLDHPQLVHDRRVVAPEHPGLGSVRQPGPMVELTVTPGDAGRPGPALDEHGPVIRAAFDPEANPVAAELSISDGPIGETPLAGVTVVEFGTFYAAPFGATLLADLGARVIKLEPLEGDPIRNIMPFPEIGGIKVMAGKECVAVDLASDEGREIAYALVAQADIVLQCFRAGVAARLGLDSDTLRALNPNLVYLNAPGYGTGGPCGHRPAFAPTIGAGSGLAMRNIGPSLPADATAIDMEELKAVSVRLGASTMSYGHADGFSALGVGTALLLGLYAARRGGPPQELTTTMLTTMAHVLGDSLVDYQGKAPLRTADRELHGLCATYRLYEAGDGRWVFLAAPQDDEWAALRIALQHWADIDSDARADDAALVATLTSVFTALPAAAWEALLVAVDVACVEVATGTVERIVTRPTGLGADHGILTTVEHPTFGEHTRLKPMVSFSRSAGVARPAALPGTHTRSVLAGLGYDADRIADLETRRIIAT